MGSEYQIQLDIIALDLESKYLIQSDLFHSTEYSKVQLLLYLHQFKGKIQGFQSIESSCLPVIDVISCPLYWHPITQRYRPIDIRE